MGFGQMPSRRNISLSKWRKWPPSREVSHLAFGWVPPWEGQCLDGATLGWLADGAPSQLCGAAGNLPSLSVLPDFHSLFLSPHRGRGGGNERFCSRWMMKLGAHYEPSAGLDWGQSNKQAGRVPALRRRHRKADVADVERVQGASGQTGQGLETDPKRFGKTGRV